MIGIFIWNQLDFRTSTQSANGNIGEAVGTSCASYPGLRTCRLLRRLLTSSWTKADGVDKWFVKSRHCYVVILRPIKGLGWDIIFWDSDWARLYEDFEEEKSLRLTLTTEAHTIATRFEHPRRTEHLDWG